MIQAAPFMVTLGYLPLLETVARVTFSLQVKIVNVGGDAIRQLCGAPEKTQHKATSFTHKTFPKLSFCTHPDVNVKASFISCMIADITVHHTTY